MSRGSGSMLALTPLDAFAAGCVSVATTVMANPVTNHGVAVNLVPQVDTERAGYFAVPQQYFTNEASIVSADTQGICFAITLRVEGQAPQLAQLTGWRVYLRGDPHFENMQPTLGPPSAPATQSIPGSLPHEEFLGYSPYCGRWGCSSSPRYVTVRQPAMINVITQSGSVCFAHGGAINPGTREVTLHLDAQGDVTRRLAFRWRFVP